MFMRGVLVLVTMALALQGCEWGTAAIREALSQYLEAVLQARHEDAYRLISTKDRELISLITFEYEAHEVGNTTKTVMLNHATFKIKRVKLGKNQSEAVARVVITMPKRDVVKKSLAKERENALREAKKNLSTYSPAERSKRLAEETDRILVQKFQSVKYRQLLDTENFQTKFDLVKEPSGWKVFLGWDGREVITMSLLLGRAKIGF